MKFFHGIVFLFLGLGTVSANAAAYCPVHGVSGVNLTFGTYYPACVRWYPSYPTYPYFPTFGAPIRRAPSYGAIAYSVNTGLAGWSANWNSQANAENEAIAQCGVDDCQTMVWFRSACAAVAISRWNESIIGYAYASNVAAAQNLAHRQCNIRGGADCYTRAWACTP